MDALYPERAHNKAARNPEKDLYANDQSKPHVEFRMKRGNFIGQSSRYVGL